MGEHEDRFDAFVTYSWPRLVAQAFVFTASRDMAQDLTQEALLRAWRHWNRVADYDDPEAWTRRVLHNLCIQQWRRPRPVPGAVPDHPAAPDGGDRHVALTAALRQLPPERARALVLHDGVGLTVAETARELGVPEGTVKSWLSRSRRVVAAHLSAGGPLAEVES